MTDKQMRRHNFVEWWKHNWSTVLLGTILLAVFAIIIQKVLYSNYFVEYLEYVNADFEWVDDFQNYEVVIPYEEQNHYLTIKDYKIKFIYANEDFLNFVVVNHEKRIIDGEDYFSVQAFYINLCYKEVE